MTRVVPRRLRGLPVEPALPLVPLVGIVAGGLLRACGAGGAADAVWGAATAFMLLPLGYSVLRTLLRRELGVDAIALVSMAGALALREELAGAVIALMLAGGNALEAAAGRRARRDLTALLARAPQVAHVRRGAVVVEVPVDDVVVGDRVVVRTGEVLPTDGVVQGEGAVVEESALTGEPLPVEYARGGRVLAGTVNAGPAFELRATRPAAESAYAALVRLVREAETRRAPFVRLADRYAALFLPLTLAAASAAWAASGDPKRALAVFVVATPCPLILAAPIALVAGVARAARAGVIVKGAGVIERLGRARTVLLDKTGTLTLGVARVERVVPLDGVAPEEGLRLAASLDQLSAHPLAEALVLDAQARGLELAYPDDVAEQPGQGIRGVVAGRRVAVGSEAWLLASGCGDGARGVDDLPGRARVLVGVDGRLAAAIFLADALRPDSGELVRGLRDAGVRHVALVTGDRRPAAEEIGGLLGLDRVYAEQTPEAKLEVVRALQAQPGLTPVVMVGDGVNDAPALAVADVGVAVGAGATVAAETADAVIVVDRIGRVADALRIGRRSLGIARQSVLAGLGLSLGAMVLAGLGLVAPLPGALLQEGIDVAVILNALRALRG